MRVAGIDVGAATAKAVVLENSRMLGSAVRPTGYDVKVAADKVMSEALDEAGMSSVYFTGQAPPFLPPGRSTAPSELAELPRLARFELAGGGHGLVDGEPVMIWAAVYRDGDTAAEAIALVRGQLEDGRSFVTNRPLREMVEVRSAETKGSLALITLAPRDDTSIGLLWRMMLARDFLYTSGS